MDNGVEIGGDRVSGDGVHKHDASIVDGCVSSGGAVVSYDVVGIDRVGVNGDSTHECDVNRADRSGCSECATNGVSSDVARDGIDMDEDGMGMGMGSTGVALMHAAQSGSTIGKGAVLQSGLGLAGVVLVRLVAMSLGSGSMGQAHMHVGLMQMGSGCTDGVVVELLGTGFANTT
jgi:hypothetical protein